MGLVTIASDQLINGVASRLIYEGSICDSWPCWNEGTCVSNGTRSFKCECPPLFTGEQCERKISDLCEENKCFLDNCWINGRSYNCSPIFKGKTNAFSSFVGLKQLSCA
ncbi:unnamed protein product [Auanema sp. JU1783]|nr:unnamed protein product [Auanema sp. JU1783]